MVIKGRSRSNGAQLADYLQHSKANDHVRIIDIRGTARPDSLRRSLLEMSLTSELTERGSKGLYHAQVNPAIGEDQPMTHEDWLKAADILEAHLGFDGQKRAIVLHEKNGRIHGHVVWERYDHDTGTLRSDSQNFKKHDLARAQIEQTLGHVRTAQKADRSQEPTHQERLTALWQDNPDGRSFIKAAEQAGYHIAYRDDRRPFRAITPEGESVDLVRQLDGIKTKAVRDSLQPIRAELQTEADALQRVKNSQNRASATPKLPDNSRELSDSQERALAMIRRVRKEVGIEKPEAKICSYRFTIKQPLAFNPQPAPEKPSDKARELSDSQDLAASMLERYRQRQKMEAQQRQEAANDNKQKAEQSEIERLMEQQRQIRQRGRSRGGYSR